MFVFPCNFGIGERSEFPWLKLNVPCPLGAFGVAIWQPESSSSNATNCFLVLPAIPISFSTVHFSLINIKQCMDFASCGFPSVK